MPLLNTRETILKAQANSYAVPAFNAENMEMVQAIVEAATELNSPVIIQTTPSTIKYGGLESYYYNVYALAKDVKIPVAIHLDHGNSFDLAAKAFRVGYTSIMIDGSHLPISENIILTNKVLDMCTINNVSVEAELGIIGGKEDDLDGGSGGYTLLEEVVEFLGKAKVDSLAIAIGTSHGLYKAVPKLDVERLKVIRAKVDTPLVLHGGSGLSEEAIRDCIRNGMCKVNFATELRIAYTEAVIKYVTENPKVIDVKAYSAVARTAVKNLVKEKILICMSNDKA